VDRAVISGAIGVLIANNVPGDPPSFSFGGGANMTETSIIRLDEGNLIKSQIPTNTVNVSVSPAISVPLVGSMVASSSRGPNYSFSAIKPDIGAPGASVSAVSGSGTGMGRLRRHIRAPRRWWPAQPRCCSRPSWA
jgi:minor extracellular serine protease Vpr